jgi:hypothetical protein
VLANELAQARVRGRTRSDRHRTPSSVSEGKLSGSFSGVITGVFIAESASVVDDKLSVSGGVLSHLWSGLTRKPGLCLWC